MIRVETIKILTKSVSRDIINIFSIENRKADTMPKSMDIKRKYRRRMLLLAALTVFIFFASFALGRYSVSPGQLIKILADALLDLIRKAVPSVPDMAQTWTDNEAAVVLNIRLPRIICAAVVGAALSVAGASYQGIFRNPMVSPDILGASTGAGFGAALGILLGLGYMGITVSSFVCGVGAVALAWLLGRASRLDNTLAMVLAGMMVGSLFSSGTSYIKLVADTQEQLPAITYWLMGSLASVKGRDAWFVILPVAMGMIPLILLRWRINLLTVSEEEARSMGINTTLLRTVVIICATLMTAASVAISGMIGWVGLVIPHFCRMMFGSDYRRLIPSGMLLGSAFLIVVDNVARVAATSEIPLGILTSFVGAPVFILLITKGGEMRGD